MVSYCPHGRLPCDAAGCRLYLSERDSDVCVRVRWRGEEWRLPAHRLLLSSSSEVFRKMFDADMLEGNRGALTIEDSSPLAVKGLLRYLYTGAADFPSWTEALDLLKIAHKYGVHTLVSLCESHLAESVTFSNACLLQEAAQTYALVTLEKSTAALVLGAAFVLLHTEGFLRMAPAALHRFLGSRDLVVESESSVLSALREWATTRCSRKGIPLDRQNVRREMEPFLGHIRWSMVPACQRERPAGSPDEESPRISFHVSAALQTHISVLKFVVELGAFHEGRSSPSLLCLRFGVDNHAFVVGFRLVGMFRNNSGVFTGPSSLTLAKEDHKTYTQFNLNSLPWTKGTVVGDYVWRELTAYLPFPVRVDPFGNYVISLKSGSKREFHGVKWPCTRLDSGIVTTSLGTINFHCCSDCYGLTQLFMLPAPPVKRALPMDFQPRI